MGSPLLGILRLIAYLGWTLLLVPAQALAMALKSPLRFRIPMFYHAGCTRIVGLDLVVRGTMAAPGPVLFVSNHSSYLDITVLGTLIPGSFVAKSEVAGWPMFGMLAKLQRTVFIERKARSTAGRQRDDLKARLDGGDNLILFPEGTSSDGNRTLPFKTALFAVAGARVDGRPLAVQPVSVAATRLDGLPMGLAFRPFYAWYGDMDLAPHLWQAFCVGRITVEVEFHDPVTIEAFASRKALGEHCWRAVAAGVSRAVSGRHDAPVPSGEGVAPQAPSEGDAGGLKAQAQPDPLASPLSPEERGS